MKLGNSDLMKNNNSDSKALGLIINGESPIISHSIYGAQFDSNQLDQVLVKHLVILLPFEEMQLRLKSNDSTTNKEKWNVANDSLLVKIALQYKLDWKRILTKIKKTASQVFTVHQLKTRYEMIKPVDNLHTSYTRIEDVKLIENINRYGTNWAKVAGNMPGRDLFSVRNRYYYLKKR